MNLKIENITKRFADFAMEQISFSVSAGEYFVIMGPSGSGKTLLLEMIAGLIAPDSGTISGIDRRQLGFIYQDYMLFPHLDVAGNIGYGLKIRKIPKAESAARVADISEKLGIRHLLKRKIDNLSGGEKQRVAIARAMAIEPRVYLLDEPTAALDRNIRYETQRMFLDLHRKTGATFIQVTHDFEEAITLADRVAVMDTGKMIQAGSPEQIFNQPVNSRLAAFLGYRNVFCGEVADFHLKINGVSLEVPVEKAEKIYVALRSDDIILSEKRIESSARNRLSGCISDFIFKNGLVDVIVDTGIEFSVSITRKSYQEMKLRKGKKVWLTFKVSALRCFEH